MTLRTLICAGIAAAVLAACGGGSSSSNSAATDNTSNGAMATASAPAAATSEAPAAAGSEAPGAMPAAGTKPDCGAVQPVWVNLKTKVYHEPSDPMYGKTKKGEYLCPADAKKQGFHPAGGAMKGHSKM